MPGWLSEEWLKELAAQAASRPAAPGATGTVSVAVTGGPDGDAYYHWSYRDGVPGDGAIGAAADADLTVIVAHADASSMATGEVEPSVAYMRGRLKAGGEGALLLALLASTATEGYREWRRRVVARAEPGPAASGPAKPAGARKKRADP